MTRNRAHAQWALASLALLMSCGISLVSGVAISVASRDSGRAVLSTNEPWSSCGSSDSPDYGRCKTCESQSRPNGKNWACGDYCMADSLVGSNHRYSESCFSCVEKVSTVEYPHGDPWGCSACLKTGAYIKETVGEAAAEEAMNTCMHCVKQFDKSPAGMTSGSYQHYCTGCAGIRDLEWQSICFDCVMNCHDIDQCVYRAENKLAIAGCGKVHPPPKDDECDDDIPPPPPPEDDCDHSPPPPPPPPPPEDDCDHSPPPPPPEDDCDKSDASQAPSYCEYPPYDSYPADSDYPPDHLHAHPPNAGDDASQAPSYIDYSTYDSYPPFGDYPPDHQHANPPNDRDDASQPPSCSDYPPYDSYPRDSDYPPEHQHAHPPNAGDDASQPPSYSSYPPYDSYPPDSDYPPDHIHVHPPNAGDDASQPPSYSDYPPYDSYSPDDL
eukprot:gene23262-30490_t